MPIAQDSQALDLAGRDSLEVPVLVLGGELGLGNQSLEPFRQVAKDVTGGIVPVAGHWITEQRPGKLVALIEGFAG